MNVATHTHLDNQHAQVALALLQVPVVDLPDPRAEHDGLQPLPPLPVREAHPESAGVALDEGLAKLVAVVRGSVAGVKQNLKEKTHWLREWTTVWEAHPEHAGIASDGRLVAIVGGTIAGVEQNLRTRIAKTDI